MSERRLKLIMEWFEAHPERYKAVQKKLANVGAKYKELEKDLRPMVKKGAEQAAVAKATEKAHADEAMKIFKKKKGVERLAKVMTEYDKIMKRSQGRLEIWSKKLLKAGWRVGFFGWIISYGAQSVLRIFRQLWEAFEKLIQVSVDWPTSLEKVFTALALLESQGLLTADMEDMLYGTMDRLLTLGPTFQALWTGLEATFISFATVITSQLIPYLQELIQWLAELLAQEKTKQMLADLGIALFKLIRALVEALPAILAVVGAFTAWMPIITTFIRTLAPFLPIIFILGTAIWLLGPALTIAGYAMKLFTMWQMLSQKAAQAATFSIFGLSMSYATLRAVIMMAVGAVLIAVSAFMLFKKLSEDWKNSFKKMRDITDFSMKDISLSINRGMGSNMAVTREALSEMNIAMSESFRNMEFVTEEVFFAMSQATGLIVDANGNVIGSFDEMGRVVDTEGNLMAAKIDWLSGEVYDPRTGEIIGYVEGIGDSWKKVRDDIDIATTDIAKDLEGLETNFGGVADASRWSTEAMITMMAFGIHPVAGAAVGLALGLHELGKAMVEMGGPAKGFVDWCDDVATAIENVGKAIADYIIDAFEDAGDVIGDTINWLKGLCFKHAAADIELFTAALRTANAEMISTERDLATLQGTVTRPTLGMGEARTVGAAGPTSIYMPLTFEAVHLYGFEDLEEFMDYVSDRVSKTIAEASTR